MPQTPTYDRPTSATLHVRLGNGEEFAATAADLAKFGYIPRDVTYMRFDDTLRSLLGKANLIGERHDITNAHLNPLRYLVEVAICYPDMLEHPEHKEVWQEIVVLEQLLAEHADELTTRLAALAAGAPAAASTAL